jgi:hypothetical protein
MVRIGYPRALAVAAAGALTVGLLSASSAAASAAPSAGQDQPTSGQCALGPTGSIKHVIYIQFDNVHFTRDNPSVPSDLEQMPNLLNFITGNGTLISREHTPLIAHTADDITTSESGLYGSDKGVPIANEYYYYKPDGTADQAGSFAYWTDPIVDYNTDLAGTPVGDSTPTMIGANGNNAPAPWVPYTRAGCNFGTVAGANTELENTLPDVAKVFGANSPEAQEAGKTDSTGADQAQAEADFMGLAVHCARGAAVCASGSVPDVLADEPGGYKGYRALFGNKFIQPAISPSGPVTNLDGQVIEDSFGQIGFPGYDGMTGPNGLAYTLDMQLHGVSVTDTYLSDVHDAWDGSGPFGPGQAGYESQLQQENAAFGTFFSTLAAHGITKANTLFVITADEGDHFVGSAPTPANCDGVTITCNYSAIGEVNAYLPSLLAAKGSTAPFAVQADSAPSIYVNGQPGRTTDTARSTEQAAATLTGPDLATGETGINMTNYLADPVELQILHMVTADPKRTPTFTLFGNDTFWQENDPTICGTGVTFCEPTGTDAWNHGTVGSQIDTTWLGVAGPGVANLGVDNSVWSDETNIQPTMMALLGLQDDYAPDGRVLGEIFTSSALPVGMRANQQELEQLGRVYTQLEAPVGRFGLSTLTASTKALASVSPGDTVYNTIENQLIDLGQQRDTVAGQMRDLLLGAAFRGQELPVAQANELISEGDQLLRNAAQLAD